MTAVLVPVERAAVRIVKIIIGQAIRPGYGGAYMAWQRELTAEAARFPGYLSSELNPPTDGQPDWTAVYRFDSVANARNWLDSATRQSLLDRAAPFFASPGTRQIIADGNEAGDALVTVVVTHTVPPEQVDEFLAWQKQTADAQRTFPGFRGVEVFRPVDGEPNQWTICLKFATAANLDAWLTSDERKTLLDSGKFSDFTMRRIDHSYGNWFALGDQPVKPPSNVKTSLAVWMGLYPTVMFLTWLTNPLHLPLWSGLLLGNLISCFVMTYLTMPYYGNRILGWWLRPKPTAPQPRTDMLGIAVVVGLNALWAVVFYVLTIKVWHQG